MKKDLQATEAVAAAEAPPARADEFPEFLDRDLSWLQFNQRVLHQALDERTRLLDRWQRGPVIPSIASRASATSLVLGLSRTR